MSESTTTATADTTTLVAGAPVWVDLSVTDLGRSQNFYREVLGWEFTGGDPEQFGGYVNATAGGRLVAGLAPPMPGMDEPPHAWTTYLRVEDAAAAEQRILDAGGSVLVPAMQLEDLGTMGLYADPTGAAFGTWQPGRHTGFETTRGPGAVAWSEAMVGDFERGKLFYSDVFGWTYQDLSEDGMDYAIFAAPGDAAGMTGGIGHEREQPRASWSVVFRVEGTDEAVRRVREAGGGVVVEPFDFEHGRLAIVVGPDGEQFGVITDPPSA